MKFHIKVSHMKWGVISFGIIILIGIVIALLGFRLVLQESMPKGIYKRVSGTPEIENPVIIKLSAVWSEYSLARGYVEPHVFEDREQNAVKWLVGAEGDLVSIKQEGVRVNGKLLALSAQRQKDSKGRLMPDFHMEERKLGEGEYVVLSHLLERGFDSRYYGVLTSENILSKARIAYTFSSIQEDMSWLYVEE